MALRWKLMLITGAVLGAMIVALLFAGKTVLMAGFQKAEDLATRGDAKALLNTVDSELANIDILSGDWAIWDDTYQFMQDRNEDYIKANATDVALADLHLNLLVLADMDGRIILGRAFNLEQKPSATVLKSIEAHLSANSPLRRSADPKKPLTGLLCIPDGILLVAASPIFDTAHTKSARGVLIMGRWLDAPEVVAHIPGPFPGSQSVTIQRADAPDLPPDFAIVRDGMTGIQSIFLQVRNEKEISAYVLLKDIYGKPAVILRVNMPRPYYQMGMTALSHQKGIIIAAGFMLLCLMWGLQERIVLVPLARLAAAAADLHQVSNELSTAGSFDELCHQVVVRGRQLLGYQRISLWFRVAHSLVVTGSFGVDEQGEIRDERGQSLTVSADSLMGQVLNLQQQSLLISRNYPLRNYKEEMVGHGTNVIAALWDGAQVIGCICMDNLLEPHRSLQKTEGEILKLYASTVGHLVTRKRTEETLNASYVSLLKSENRYRTLVEGAEVGITLIDPQYRILMVNAAMGRMLHKPVFALVGRQCFREFEKRSEVCPHCPGVRAMASGLSAEVETRGVWDDGNSFPVRVRAFPLLGTDRKAQGFIEVIEDITERKAAEQKIIDHQMKLRALAFELTMAEDRTQRQVALELHDQVGQSLSMAKLRLQRAAREAGNNPSSKTGDLTDAIALVDQAIRNTRTLVFELCPPILSDLGLEAALEWLAEQFGEKHGLRVRFHDDKRPKPLTQDVNMLLFRATRELLTNVVKHAKAREATVSIWTDNDCVHVSVRDDGVGFDDGMEQGDHGKGKNGFGLFSIRERISIAGGRLEFQSKAGAGSCVEIAVPTQRNL